MKLLKEIDELINLNKQTKINMENIVIGNKQYVIFYLNNKDRVIKNKIITNIILNDLNYYFFSSRSEMNEFIEYIEDDSKQVSFIFIG